MLMSYRRDKFTTENWLVKSRTVSSDIPFQTNIYGKESEKAIERVHAVREPQPRHNKRGHTVIPSVSYWMGR